MTDPDILRNWANIADGLRNLPDMRGELNIQPSEEAREGLLDLVSALALAGEAAAAFARGDDLTG